MNLDQLIQEYWKEVYPDNVIHLSSYKLERARKYPGVSVKIFTDFSNHKRWMISEMKRIIRKSHNDALKQKYINYNINEEEHI